MRDEIAERLRQRDEDACDGFSEADEYLRYQSASGALHPRERRTDYERPWTTDELESLGGVVQRMLDALATDLQDPEYLRCESPIEQLLFREIRVRFPRVPIRTQVWMGRYRVDFLIGGRTIVECDGAAFHGPDRQGYDRQREADLRGLGYGFVRLTGREIRRDMDACMERIFGQPREGWRRA